MIDMGNMAQQMVVTIELQRLKNKLSVLDDLEVEETQLRLDYAMDCISVIDNAFKAPTLTHKP